MADKRRSKAAAKSREELRRENRQALEQHNRRQHAILVIGLVAVIVVAAVILSLTVFFNITAVEVDVSQSQYTADQVREASGVEEGDNLFLMRRAEVAEEIGHKLPYAGEVTVKRKLPTKVRIYVEDSSVANAVKYNDEFVLLNDNYTVLAKVGSIDSLNKLVELQNQKAAERKKTASKKKTGTKEKTKKEDKKTDAETAEAESTTAFAGDNEIAGGEDLRNATDQVCVITGVKVKSAKVGYTLVAQNAKVFETYQEIRAAMDRWGVRDITSADLTKVSDIKLTYQQRITILLGSASGLDRKAAMCAKVIEEQDKVSTEQKGYIDLSIEGKAYFSEGGATTRTTTTTVIEVTEPTVNDPTAVSGERSPGIG
ncbi:MAG: FtsQ-type POTRA domain-containing protein [Clostridia bacterium]|nr:FtsQ-type POTRA domain-containing protein [Clostridia bacterium]